MVGGDASCTIDDKWEEMREVVLDTIASAVGLSTNMEGGFGECNSDGLVRASKGGVAFEE